MIRGPRWTGGHVGGQSVDVDIMAGSQWTWWLVWVRLCSVNWAERWTWWLAIGGYYGGISWTSCLLSARLTGARRPYHHESATALWPLWEKQRLRESTQRKNLPLPCGCFGKSKGYGSKPRKKSGVGDPKAVPCVVYNLVLASVLRWC